MRALICASLLLGCGRVDRTTPPAQDAGADADSDVDTDTDTGSETPDDCPDPCAPPCCATMERCVPDGYCSNEGSLCIDGAEQPSCGDASCTCAENIDGNCPDDCSPAWTPCADDATTCVDFCDARGQVCVEACEAPDGGLGGTRPHLNRDCSGDSTVAHACDRSPAVGGSADCCCADRG